MSIAPLTAEQYHADPAPAPSLSSSIANILLDQSPLHAWLAHPKLNPNYVREVDSRFDLGSAAHLMLLERREDRIVIVDADDWRTNKAKEQRDDAHLQGKYAILRRHYDDIVIMCRKAREFLAGTELTDMLDTGAAEQTVVWQEDDFWYRCRPDLLSADHRVVLDYKSTDSASHEAFAKQIGRMGYDLQAEFYTRGLTAVTGIEPVFVFLAQEITPPYACSISALSNAYRAVGQAKVKRAMSIWRGCLTGDLWPAYTCQLLYAEPKPWDMTLTEEWQ
jgi:hypothetical protein